MSASRQQGKTATPLVSERREEILALAAKIFADKGYASTTVREIADAAGILSGSLYHHFDSKEAMLDEIMHGFLDHIVAQYRATVAAGGDPLDVLRALIREAFSSLGGNPAALAVMINEFNFLVQFPRFAYLREGAEETERLWSGVIEEGMRTGVFRSDIDSRMIYRFMRDTIWISVRWYRPDGKYSPEEIADFYVAMLLDGLATGGSTDTGGAT
ncbi:MAG TPA: TetR/AcrR family transcriptional regulator [Acidimicrobiia bacterium]|nr:TetR/AcrR family transcriptional regulator [Acidimicrobiia bacterium]